jgi:hypothetical protein
LLLLPLSLSQAQNTPWEVVVYAEGSNALQVLRADGISLTIGAGSRPLHIGSYPSTPLVAISPARRALAALNFTPYQPLSVTIAAFGSCCKTVSIRVDATVQAQIGSFSPNSRRFAVSYAAVPDESSNVVESGIATVDVELGAVISRLDMNGSIALLRGWGDEGIDYLPVCYACDMPPAGSLSRWNPDTDEVTRDVGYYDAAQDTLAVTGETITPARRPDFPLPIADNTFTQNVVTFGDDARVIYYNPNDLPINSAHWVADGWDVLVEHPNSTVLLDRAGMKKSVNAGDHFLVGTPDGWLATRDNNGATEVVHHTLANLDGRVIARFYHPITVVQATPLGATASRGGFPDVPSPISRITCPDALPPRLFGGGKGRAISGGVNLRREPSLTAASIATINNEIFDVIGGPVCDPTGIAWWQVGLGGLRGWMAESSDGVYLLQPVLH